METHHGRHLKSIITEKGFEIYYGKGTRPNAPKIHESGISGSCQDKFTTMEA